MTTEVPEVLNDREAVNDEQLSELEAALVAEFDELHDSGSRDVAAMEAVAAELERVTAERARRDAEDSEADDRIAELRNRVHADAEAEAQPEGAEGEGDDDADPAEGAEGADDAAPAEPQPEPQPVTAAARRPASARNLARNAPGAGVPARGTDVVITAAADIAGYAAGQRIGVIDIAKGFHSKARALADGSPRVPVASIQLPTPAADTLTGNRVHDAEVLDRVCSPGRLFAANGLVAAGGWCGPHQPLWDLFRIDAADALFDLPELTIGRGGGVQVPDFIGVGTGMFDAAEDGLWTWLEADDIAATASGRVVNKALTTNVATLTTDAAHNLAIGDVVIISGVDSVFNGTYTVASVPTTTTFTYAKTNANVASAATNGYWANTTSETKKPCVRIPCPTWTDYELEAEGLCVTHGNLADRSFPELTREFVRTVTNLHMIRVSNAKLAKVIATATAATVTDPVSDAAGNVMHAVDLSATDFRDRYLMSEGAILEAVFPLWGRAAIRASIAMRAGIPIREAMSITNADIDAWFRARGVRPQFVRGYQKLNSGSQNNVAYPTTMKFLVYPAGGYFSGNGGSIDLGVQRDSRLNETNDFTAAWSEQFYLVGQRGPDAREVTIDIDVDGITACCA